MTTRQPTGWRSNSPCLLVALGGLFIYEGTSGWRVTPSPPGPVVTVMWRGSSPQRCANIPKVKKCVRQRACVLFFADETQHQNERQRSQTRLLFQPVKANAAIVVKIPQLSWVANELRTVGCRWQERFSFRFSVQPERFERSTSCFWHLCFQNFRQGMEGGDVESEPEKQNDDSPEKNKTLQLDCNVADT